jgi:uncharacterized repeat protein (TIGR04076 family)
MSKARITVLRRMVNDDLIDRYEVREDCRRCPKFEEGQEFVAEGSSQPEGFCGWAWADIQRHVHCIMSDGSPWWIREKGVHIASCSDGLRPVVFKIERMPE